MKQPNRRYGEMIRSAWQQALRGNNPFVLILGGVVASLGSAVTVGLLSGPLAVGLATASLKVVRGEEAEVDDLKAGFRSFMPSFLAGILFLAAVLVGFALLLVPGIAALFLFMYTAHVLADDPDLTAVEALKESAAIARDSLSPTTVLLVIVAVTTGVLSATGIGAVIAASVLAVLIAQFYVEVDEAESAAPPSKTPSPSLASSDG